MVSIFDVIGPVMVGPSSSHTAGAARLGYAAGRLFGQEVRQVDFYLHGSFAETHRGHGTDRALLAGILGLKPDDERIPDAFRLADERGIVYHFFRVDLGDDVHPNTVRIIITGTGGSTYEITGASIGGGSILITSVNGLKLEITGYYPALITRHQDRPGIVSTVAQILAQRNINIAFMKLFRQGRGSEAVMVVETDEPVAEDIVREVAAVDGIRDVKVLDRMTG